LACHDGPMRPALLLLVLFAPLLAWGRGEISHFVDKLSCDGGPYALKLPKTYAELRRLAPLKGERVLRKEDMGGYTAVYRNLIFNGLRLEVVTYSDDSPYQVSSAEIRSAQWRIAGPFRAGQALPPRVGDVATHTLRATTTVEFSGDEDTVRVRLVGRKVSVLTYLCLTD